MKYGKGLLKKAKKERTKIIGAKVLAGQNIMRNCNCNNAQQEADWLKKENEKKNI